MTKTSSNGAVIMSGAALAEIKRQISQSFEKARTVDVQIDVSNKISIGVIDSTALDKLIKQIPTRPHAGHSGQSTPAIGRHRGAAYHVGKLPSGQVDYEKAFKAALRQLGFDGKDK